MNECCISERHRWVGSVGWGACCGEKLSPAAFAPRRCLALNRSHGCVRFSDTGRSDEIIAPPQQNLRALDALGRAATAGESAYVCATLFTTVFSLRQMQACGEPALAVPVEVGLGDSEPAVPRQQLVDAVALVLGEMRSSMTAHDRWPPARLLLSTATQARTNVTSRSSPPQWHSLKGKRHSLKDAFPDRGVFRARRIGCLVMQTPRPSPAFPVSTCRSACASAAARSGSGASCAGTRRWRRRYGPRGRLP